MLLTIRLLFTSRIQAIVTVRFTFKRSIRALRALPECSLWALCALRIVAEPSGAAVLSVLTTETRTSTHRLVPFSVKTRTRPTFSLIVQIVVIHVFKHSKCFVKSF